MQGNVGAVVGQLQREIDAMKIADLQYDLPDELIAQAPAERRDASRLMVVDRANGEIRHESFDRLVKLLPPRALLVMNDTKVLPARLQMRRQSGGKVRGLFLREAEPGIWELMVTSGRRLKPGESLSFESGLQSLRMLQRLGEGTWRAEPVPAGRVGDILARYGSAPLPPYIHREQAAENPPVGENPPVDDCRDRDLQRYQTVYARQPGAVAAPTAGLHFTPRLLERIDIAGMSTAFVTLHVGVGTFAPIRVDELAEHTMHSEWYECSPATAYAVNAARQSGRPVVAVGTTSVRVLETCANEQGCVTPGSGWTNIFIYPPYQYRVVNVLITNFHLPGSTLLALVFAFAGREQVLQAYERAIQARYRFYSYGDAMLIR
jgi:S-adenosylmethionine:tRNA ribosyltransferase-isomerase